MSSLANAPSGAGRLSASELDEIVACPACRNPVSLSGEATACPSCGHRMARLPHSWDLLPPRETWSSGTWQIWEQLQANGEASYEADPEANLGVGEREDCLAFSRFADLKGTVLDVGCGPQAWPTYLDVHEPGTRFVGVDPLVGGREAAFTQLRALAETLPFVDGVFDRVVFATTLDHFVDPVTALVEAKRVLKPGGLIAVWLGHKSQDAPKPERSPEWYTSLEVPEGADDLFHVKRMTPDDGAALFAEAGLAERRAHVQQVDPYRSNHLYLLEPAT